MTSLTTAAAGFVERLYDAAARAGLLQRCSRLVEHPIGTNPSVDVAPDAWVALIEPDEALLDGLAMASDPSIRFPASVLIGLKKGELLEVDGITYRVREVRPVGDGSEKRAHLSRATVTNAPAPSS